MRKKSLKKHTANKKVISVSGPDDNIAMTMPKNKKERNKILRCVEQYVLNENLTPPPSKEELWKHAEKLIKGAGISELYYDLVKVLINNEIWKSTVVSVPYERRLLLIPQCLRSKNNCRAEIDEFGLLCEQCGACPIGDIQAEAEDLGYVVLVAEGTTVVTSLLESGKVDAVIGVSCLNALEKTFPHLTNHAIPGIAIPLAFDGCEETEVDLDWLRNTIKLKSEEAWLGRLELQQLHDEVSSWFQIGTLKEVIGECSTNTQHLALSWLAGNGKRWRPFLAVIVFKALNGIEKELNDSIKKLAIAVECFHKASLIHDDIEDEDDFRYGKATMHRQHGVAIALNTGDLLIGEGYRLIADCGASGEQISKMLTIAAEGHNTLCIGQGEELICMKEELPPSSKKVLEIFRNKTSPAFEVALSLGACCAGGNGDICGILKKYSESLGTAYQIRDDIEDFQAALENNNAENIFPSLLLAMTFENSDTKTRRKLINFWNKQDKNNEIMKILSSSNIVDKAKQLAEYYKNEAVRSLSPLKSAPLKSLLRRVIGKIIGK